MLKYDYQYGSDTFSIKAGKPKSDSKKVLGMPVVLLIPLIVFIAIVAVFFIKSK
jgi:hypothetical protein